MTDVIATDATTDVARVHREEPAKPGPRLLCLRQGMPDRRVGDGRVTGLGCDLNLAGQGPSAPIGWWPLLFAMVSSC